MDADTEAEVRKALLADLERVNAALDQAVRVIRTWHGMSLPPEQEGDAWNLYYAKAPEMALIRRAAGRSGAKLTRTARKPRRRTAPSPLPITVVPPLEAG